MECPPRQFSEFREDISQYLSCRSTMLDHITKILNMINQLSHVKISFSGSGSGGSGSSHVAPIKLESVSGVIRDEIHEVLLLLNESEAKIVNSLKIISFAARNYCAVNSKSNEGVNNSFVSWPIDGDHLLSVVHKLQQQTLLELSVVEEVVKAVTKMTPIDQSKSISLLACFAYSPYMSSNELTAIIALQ